MNCQPSSDWSECRSEYLVRPLVVGGGSGDLPGFLVTADRLS